MHFFRVSAVLNPEYETPSFLAASRRDIPAFTMAFAALTMLGPHVGRLPIVLSHTSERTPAIQWNDPDAPLARAPSRPSQGHFHRLFTSGILQTLGFRQSQGVQAPTRFGRQCKPAAQWEGQRICVPKPADKLRPGGQVLKTQGA